MENPVNLPLDNFVDLLMDGICAVDASGRFVFVSAACEQIFGYTPAEMIGMNMRDMILPEDIPKTMGVVQKIMSGKPQNHFENRYVRKDGQIVHVMWSARWSDDHQMRFAVARDITKRKAAEAVQGALYAISEAAHSAEDLPALSRQIHQIIGGLLPATNFFVALYDGVSDELSFPYFVDQCDPLPAPRKLGEGTLTAEVIRTGLPLLVTPETSQALPEHLRVVIGTDALYWLGVPLKAQDDVIGALVVQSYSPNETYSTRDQRLLQFVSAQVATAIERKRLHTRLLHLAQFDQLTGLANRELLRYRLKSALATARRENGGLCVLYCDLDNFKQVNDSHGHGVGDLLLQQVAHRLQQCVRKSDTVARVGGDEFVMLLEGVSMPADVAAIANKILDALVLPFPVAGLHLHIRPSIGCAIYPDDGEDETNLLLKADAAMYSAKRQGGNHFQMPG